MDNHVGIKEKSIKQYKKSGKLATIFYEQELAKLQFELVKLQYWIKDKGLRVCLVFEGRDAAGKGGIIKRIREPLNPRGCRVVALSKPSDVEITQWYFQRYVDHLPSSGEMVIFDRSWYNRAGIERVMGFCTDEEYTEFLRSCPEFEKMLTRSGIILIKYWVSVSDEEQERRLKDRVSNPAKRWKFSEMDLKSWNKWEDFSRAKDNMFKYTDTKINPWWNVESDDKKKARLNCISHILSQINYQDVTPKPIELPPRKIVNNYIRPPQDELSIVPDKY
jgi:polyphosphate kinase